MLFGLQRPSPDSYFPTTSHFAHSFQGRNTFNTTKTSPLSAPFEGNGRARRSFAGTPQGIPSDPRDKMKKRGTKQRVKYKWKLANILFDSKQADWCAEAWEEHFAPAPPPNRTGSLGLRVRAW